MRLYRKGDSGEPVRDIQGRLAASGVGCEPDRPGEFGPGTVAAVRSFQRARGLDPDGIVGPHTWRELVESSFRLGDRLLYYRVPMLRGDDVAELQRRLNALGFDAGKVDGIFGPDTLTALLDFQSNRNMAEDGIAGTRVGAELALVERATRKEGREGVRERQWLRQLPASVAGQRILVDAYNRDDKEDVAAWQAATGAARMLAEQGAQPLLSRSADTRPTERIRAQRANRLGVDLVVSFALPRAEQPGVFYFASQHSRSAAGELLAGEIAGRLKVAAAGRSVPMLRETRPPAAVVAVDGLSAEVGRTVAFGVQAFYVAQWLGRESAQDQPPNNT